MSKYTKIKAEERKKAVKANITDKLLREPLGGNSFRVVNPLRMVERVAIRKYKAMNWVEKTKFNSL